MTWALKTLISMDSFWAKHKFFELKNYKEFIFHDTEEWYTIWRGIDLSFTWGQLTNFEMSTGKSRNLSLQWAPFGLSIQCFSWKSKEELCSITLKIDAKYEGTLTCTFKNDMRNLAVFTDWKIANLFYKVKWWS